MHGRQLYLILTMTALALIVGALTLGGIWGKLKDGSEAASAVGSVGDPMTPNQTLDLVTVSPSLGPSKRPSPQAPGEVNTTETSEPSNESRMETPPVSSESPTLSPMTTNDRTPGPFMESNSSSLYPSPSPSLAGLAGRLPTLTPIKSVNYTGVFSGDGTRFYAIGDVPYSDAEARTLQVQISNLPTDAEFLIHVGDIRSARDGRTCEIDEYYKVAGILNQSHAPVFLVVGGTYPPSLLYPSYLVSSSNPLLVIFIQTMIGTTAPISMMD